MDNHVQWALARKDLSTNEDEDFSFFGLFVRARYSLSDIIIICSRSLRISQNGFPVLSQGCAASPGFHQVMKVLWRALGILDVFQLMFGPSLPGHGKLIG